MELLVEYLAKGFMTMLAISMPCVLTAASIGLVVGIIQAVTQVQEQTIAAAPKIFAVFLVIVIGGMGFIKLLTNLFNEGMGIAFNVIPRNDNYVLASDFYQYTSPLQAGELSNKYPKNLQLREVIKRPSDAPFLEHDGKLKYDKSPRTPMPKPNFIETNKIIGR
ncbi:MAG: flagellar biosynthetic protein FliQ [Candidatus Gastranaerophilales bacterium]|nr:flagellar biosynthetic protein FliQ [Candidatus Gastranaerophilales bacterium]